jgi:hypothetical protein
MRTIAERVAAGAAFLDEHDPGWWRADVERAIDLDTFDLAEPEHCVLGQRCPVTVLAEYCGITLDSLTDDDLLDELSPEWWRAYTAYAFVLSGFNWGDALSLTDWGDRHGFSNSDDLGGWEGYPDLTAEWKRAIEARRAGVPA